MTEQHTPTPWDVIGPMNILKRFWAYIDAIRFKMLIDAVERLGDNQSLWQ